MVVWNCTRACNLKCIHCYAGAQATAAPEELTTAEARAMLGDLADFGTPVILFSGGEPMMRPDLLELARAARDLGLRPVLSTNGTLIDASAARRIREADFSYVGVSLDGLGEVNDRFRGVTGAYDRALAACRRLGEVGQRVGLRLTLTRHTAAEIDRIFDLLEAEEIDRACFYHLVYSGRGGEMLGQDLTHGETLAAVEAICRRTEDFARRGMAKDILTVDNHVDGVYLYRRVAAEDAERGEEVRRLLAWNGGARYSSGVGIGCVDYRGDVHPNQFWWHHRLGNVRERRFSDIWQDESDDLLAGLRDRLPRLKGRCGACRYKELCGGASRVRAEAVFADPWAPEPACYLADADIGLTPDVRARLIKAGEDYPLPEALTGAQ